MKIVKTIKLLQTTENPLNIIYSYFFVFLRFSIVSTQAITENNEKFTGRISCTIVFLLILWREPIMIQIQLDVL